MGLRLTAILGGLDQLQDVCIDRLDSLPFDDDTFGASLCADAFHLFGRQQGSMDELRRVAHDDTVLLDRVGNVNLKPYLTGWERDPAGVRRARSLRPLSPRVRRRAVRGLPRATARSSRSGASSSTRTSGSR